MDHLTAGLEHDPFQQLREKLIVGLQYIAKIPRQQALLKILYHKCEFNDEMLAEGVIREKDGFLIRRLSAKYCRHVCNKVV